MQDNGVRVLVLLKREVLADRGEEIDLREGGRECTQFRRLQDYKGI